MKKKHIKIISLLMAITMLLTLSVPVFADGESPSDNEGSTPITQSININANYYTGEDDSYTIIFTVMEEIPAFTELTMKIKFESSSVSQAAFAENIPVGEPADILRGSDYAILPLKYTEAKSIPARSSLCTLIATSDTVPSSDNLSISDFTILKSGETEATSLSANITIAAGSIIPTLNEETQAVYEKLCELPNPSTLSYYQENGSPTNLTAILQKAISAKELYQNLPSANRADLDTVMEYYNKPNYATGSLATMIQAMIDAQGLVEIAKSTESITATNALSYQFLINVFNQKKNISLENILPDSIARTEISQVISAMQSASETVATAINTTNTEPDGGYKTKVYACQTQLSTIQGLGGHKYNTEYMDDLQAQIAALKPGIETAYSSDAIMKKALLDTLTDIEASILLIKSGIEDMPTIKVDGINRGQFYTVTFTRKYVLPSSIEAKVSFVVTDKNGVEIETAEKVFPADSLALEITLSALASKYTENEYYTITAYYHINGGRFLLDTQDVKCYQIRTEQVGGLGNNILGGGLGGAGTAKPPVAPSTPSGGGTIFPDSNDEPEIPQKPIETPSRNFIDLGNYGWATEAIDTLYTAGIINGMENGVFNPAGQVTREQFCKMVVALFDIPTSTVNTSFGDVDSNAWYAPYITAAMQAGYIQGQSGEYFGVGESIMRQDIAIILYRALGDQNSKAVLNFSDKENIAPYAEDAIAELVGLGIINGYEDGTLKPRGTATRAEAAKMIYGIYQYINR